MILLGDEGGVANSSSSSLSDVVEGLEKVASGMALNDMQVPLWSSRTSWEPLPGSGTVLQVRNPWLQLFL